MLTRLTKQDIRSKIFEILQVGSLSWFITSCDVFKTTPLEMTHALSWGHHWSIAVSITCCSRSFQTVSRCCQTIFMWCSYDVTNWSRTL